MVFCESRGYYGFSLILIDNIYYNLYGKINIYNFESLKFKFYRSDVNYE